MGWNTGVPDAPEVGAMGWNGVPDAPEVGAVGWNTGVPDAPEVGAVGWEHRAKARATPTNRPALRQINAIWGWNFPPHSVL
jgi:hypothetical protein